MVEDIRNKKIVTIGNGTGQAAILKHLESYVENISVVVGVTDNGGHSGLLRNIMNIPAPGDIRNCMSSSANCNNLLAELIRYRFTQGELAGYSLGNLIISALIDIEGDIGKACKALGSAMGLKAKFYPSTIENTQICAELENGDIIEGEFQIIRRENPELVIKRMFHNPVAEAYGPALDEIRNADVIVISPGVLRTGIISTLLAKGMKEAIQASAAKLVYVCNIMTNPGQTEDFSTWDHIDEITRYMGRKPDYALVHSGDIPEFVQEIYIKERSYPVKHINIDHKDIKIIMEDLLDEINQQEFEKLQRVSGNGIKSTPHLIRHNSKKVTDIIIDLVKT